MPYDSGVEPTQADRDRAASQARKRALRAQRCKSRYVYAVVLRESGRVKIGLARDPYERLDTLQTANPEEVCLVGYLEPEDPPSTEAALHERFAATWIRGEWFQWSAEIDAFVQNELNRDFAALHAATVAVRPPRIRRKTKLRRYR